MYYKYDQIMTIHSVTVQRYAGTELILLAVQVTPI